MTGAPLEDAVLREYLLGRLDPDSRSHLEDRLFSDDQLFWEHLCLVEDELVSEFARGTLTQDDRRAFLERFACTEERQARIAFAKALQRHIDERRNRPSLWQWMRAPLATPRWAAAAAAVLLVLAVGTVMQRSGVPSERASDVTVQLSADLTRSGGALPRVRIAPDVQLVHFQLDPGSAEHESYRLTLLAVAGGEVWSQTNVRRGPDPSGPLAVSIPSALLTEGDYYCRLEGLSPGVDPVPLYRYDFRALRE
jgi:hypothetical protein